MSPRVPVFPVAVYVAICLSVSLHAPPYRDAKPWVSAALAGGSAQLPGEVGDLGEGFQKGGSGGLLPRGPPCHHTDALSTQRLFASCFCF